MEISPPLASRCCPACKIKWAHFNMDEATCPRCNIPSFFTMNLGDIGTAIYFSQSGEKQDDYEFVAFSSVPAFDKGFIETMRMNGCCGSNAMDELEAYKGVLGEEAEELKDSYQDGVSSAREAISYWDK